MNFRRRRRRLRLIALGLATAALGASSAQAKPVIPYLSQGQGITTEVRAQLSNAGGPASGAFGNPAGTASAATSERSLQSSSASIPCIAVGGRCIDIHAGTVSAATSERGLQSSSASIPCIAVGGRCIDIHAGAAADPSKSVASRYEDHRGVPFANEAVAEPTRSIAGRYMDHPSEVVADGSKSSTGLNDRVHSRPLPSPADQQPSGTTTGTDDGFNWSDAGVGAGSTLALVLLAGMAAFTIRRSRGNQLAGT